MDVLADGPPAMPPSWSNSVPPQRGADVEKDICEDVSTLFNEGVKLRLIVISHTPVSVALCAGIAGAA